MRVLVACEFSGIVRDAFLRAGHDAVSCDLLPTESPGPHYQGDIRDLLDFDPLVRAATGYAFDLLIAHPPCTFLANSGVRWLYDGGRGSEPNTVRWNLMEDGAEFFRYLLAADVPRIAVENPVMHRWARNIVGRKPDQTIQPWQFGHGETKATCLWLKNLPPLVPTNVVDGREARVHRMPPGPDRWRERSRTFTGIAEAMAEQWGQVLDLGLTA